MNDIPPQPIPIAGSTPPEPLVDAFLMECRLLTEKVRDAIRSRIPVGSVIEVGHDSVYVKAADGTVLAHNATYEAVFSGHVVPTGRNGELYLDETVAMVSRYSDQLVLAGADETMFWHPGRDSEGRATLFQTYKASLLGMGNPRKAILGISRVLSRDVDDRCQRLMPLNRSWFLFAAMKARDQQIAASIARGEKTKSIADKLSISEKTVENARGVILKKLSLEQPIDLVKLMVRLQDNGFCDFGL